MHRKCDPTEKSSCLDEEIFGAAHALPAPERRAYVAHACDGDTELFAKICALLDADEHVDAFIKEPEQFARFDQLDDQIDDFKLIRLLGEGGAGVVFLAEQSPPMRREVALKIIKLGMDTEAVVRRFQAERQVLAIMEHPNIAKVFDAGATRTGKPFFVMELVRGIRITDYCDQCRLSLDERLSLFLQVCGAIQHAHYRGIIHRDIKPSNVLVTRYEGRPIAKVIDFGIAKATQGPLAEESGNTSIEQFVGTPAYISPEQLDGGMRQVDTRADVYSLGVLLYELLTGCTPFDAGELLDVGMDGMRQRVRTEVPITPSKKLSDRLETCEASHALRSAQRRLCKQLTGDLDCIVMTCLEKDRTRRYQTVSDLEQDIRRFMSDRPVLARPPSAAYLISRLVRRHRLAVGAGCSVVIALLSALGFSGWSAIRATRAERAAEEIVSFLQDDILLQATPEREPNRDIKLRTVLDRASRNVDARFQQQPLVEASVRRTLGKAYESLGELESAHQHLGEAAALYSQNLGPASSLALELSSEIVELLRRQSRYKEALDLGTEVLAKQASSLGSSHPSSLRTMVRLGRVHRLIADYPKATALHQAAYATYRRIFGEEHEETLDAMHSLAATYIYQGKFKEAELLLTEVLRSSRKVLGREHPASLHALTNLAVAYHGQGRSTEARRLKIEALEMNRRVMGPNHPETLVAMDSLANTYAEMGDPVAAVALLSQSLAISKEVRGPEHHYTLITMDNLAAAHEDLGEMENAVSLRLDALGIQRRILGDQHPTTLLAMNNLAFDYRILGDMRRAKELAEEVARSGAAVLGAEHPDALGYQRNLAIIHRAEGRFAEAEAILAKVVPNTQRALGWGHHDTLDASRELASVLLPQGKAAEAERLLRFAIQHTTVKGWRLAIAQSYLGEALLELQQHSPAEDQLLAGYAGLEASAKLIPAHRRTEIPLAASRLAKLYRITGMPDKAREWDGKARRDTGR